MIRRLTVIPGLPPGVYGSDAALPLPFPLEHGRSPIWPRGRHALWHAIRLLGLRAGDEVLLPAYHHGSEVETYIASGLVPRFFDSGTDLRLDPASLDSALSPRVRAVHLVHHLGRPSPVAAIRAWCDANRLLLVEDAAQAWLASDEGGAPVGSVGDAAIFSLYKSVPVPEGGALAMAGEIPVRGPGLRAMPRPIAGPLGLAGVVRRHIAWSAAASPLTGSIVARRPVPPYDPARDFAAGDPWIGASTLARRLLPRLVRESVAARRLANYRRLAASLARWIPDGFKEIPDGASPFALPVWCQDKRLAQRALAGRGVHAVDAWSVPHPTLEARRFPVAAAWRSSTLLLPVHQHLSEGDLQLIEAAAVRTLPDAGSVRG